MIVGVITTVYIKGSSNILVPWIKSIQAETANLFTEFGKSGLLT